MAQSRKGYGYELSKKRTEGVRLERQRPLEFTCDNWPVLELGSVERVWAVTLSLYRDLFHCLRDRRGGVPEELPQ